MSIANVSILIFCITVTLVTSKRGFGPGSQEYGYVEVRQGARMFFWLYYVNTVAEHEAVHRPLVIWLQGGPGGSSTGYGNFEELGTLDSHLKSRDSAWTKHVNVLFVDNPVGTGFSYVTNEWLYVNTNDEIASDLLTFTKAFYKKYQKFSNTPLYIFCESYGGKMAIQFAYELYEEIHKHKLKINFKGVALGDSWISPLDSCLTWAPYLFYTGMVDSNGYREIDRVAQQLKELVHKKEWLSATEKWGELEDVVEEVTNDVSFYNILKNYDDDNMYLRKFLVANNTMIVGKGLMNRFNEGGLSALMNGRVKKALKSVIPDSVTWGGQSHHVFSHLSEDFMKPVTNYVEKVLNDTTLHVIVYNGQLDLIVDTPGTLNWVDRLQWPGATKWQTAEREPLVVQGNEEGFIKTYDKFTFYWINRAGHMVPSDNPNGTLQMLQQITNYKKKEG